jgi:hypothetical protein
MFDSWKIDSQGAAGFSRNRYLLAVFGTLAAIAAMAVGLFAAAPALAVDDIPPEAWTGNGTVGNAGQVLNTEQCSEGLPASYTNDDGTAGAAVEPGDQYLLWVLSANNADWAKISFDGGDSWKNMTDDNGTWKFVSGYLLPLDPDDLLVKADWSPEDLAGNQVLTISHGCSGETAADSLTASKTANGSYDRTYDWTIQKDVADPTKVTGQVGGTATFNYTVTVTQAGSTDGNWLVKGKITVTNPNAADVKDVDVSDAIDGDASCPIDGGKGENETIPASGSSEFDYTCTYNTAPSDTDTNTATVEWPAQTLSNGGSLAASPASGLQPTANVDWSTVSPNEIDECVDVDDAVDGGSASPLGKVCVADSPKKFEFPLSFDIVDDCVTHTNVASFTTNDTATTDSDDASVEVCGVFFGKTMGFWGNTNGQQVLNANNAFSTDPPPGNAVTLGGETGCSVLVSSAARSKTILPNSLNGVSLITDCDATNERDTGINLGSLNTLLAQTLAISYNIKYIDHYAGQKVAELGCGLSTDTVEAVRDQANVLIKNAQKNNGTSVVTQGQIGAMNTLLGCLNREA